MATDDLVGQAQKLVILIALVYLKIGKSQPIFFDAKSKKLIDPKGNAVKLEAGGKIVGKISSLAFQTVNFAA